MHKTNQETNEDFSISGDVVTYKWQSNVAYVTEKFYMCGKCVFVIEN
jgi:hypothetical protein